MPALWPGVVLCGVHPLLVVEVNYWLGLLLGAGFVFLFALYGVRTALRQKTRYTFSMPMQALCRRGDPCGG